MIQALILTPNANSYSSHTTSSHFRRSAKKPYVQPEPSPIEVSFWETAKPLIPELEREVQIGSYRVDFLIPSKKVIIELYGYAWHNTKEKITKDKQRERELQRGGYQIMGFTGTEVFKDPRACVKEVLEYLSQAVLISQVPNPQSPQPDIKATPLPDHSPLPFSGLTGLSQRLTSKTTSTLHRPQKTNHPFGLQPRQLGILIGFLVFDFILIIAGLLLILH